MNFFIQIKQGSRVLPEHNTLCHEFNINTTIAILKFRLSGKVDLLEVFTYDSLLDSEPMELFKTIQLGGWCGKRKNRNERMLELCK